MPIKGFAYPNVGRGGIEDSRKCIRCYGIGTNNKGSLNGLTNKKGEPERLPFEPKRVRCCLDGLLTTLLIARLIYLGEKALPGSAFSRAEARFRR